MSSPRVSEDLAIEIPGAPAIPGLRFRRFRVDDDLPGMAAANNAARLAYDVEEMVDVESMRNAYANLSNSDLHDDIAVIELDGRVVGYGRVEVADQTDGSVAIETIGILEPDLRGRGIGAALLDWMEGRATALAPSLDASRERWFGAFTWDADAYARRLFEGRGYRPVRRFFEMVRPTLDDIPVVPLPDGFEVRPVGPADLRAVWEADVAMFRDHWGEIDESDAAFRRFSGDPRLDPALFVVAFDGEVIASHVLNIIDDEENRIRGRLFGILDSVGTRAEYRRRGLARALICRSLGLLRDRGMTGASLGVDAENANRALDLYTSCGFEVRSSSTAWRRPLDELLEVSR
jgi:mycothiol synthase